MPRSFLNARTEAKIRRLAIRGHETNASLSGAVWLSFSRWNSALESWVILPAQKFTITWADRKEDVEDEISGTNTSVDGVLSAPWPVDIERGDRFSFGETGSEESGQVVVVRPPNLGLVDATFRLSVGEV